MSTSIAGQLKSCIREAHVHRGDKHSAKVDGTAHLHVYSQAYVSDLKKLADQFGRYMREYHANIKSLRNVHDVHWSQFLLFQKAPTSAATTLGALVSRINKLETLVNSSTMARQLRYNVNWHSRLIKPDSGKCDLPVRTVALSDTDAKDIAAWMAENKPNCAATKAFAFACIYGLRVSELAHLRVRHINLGRGRIEIREGSKGGRARDLPIHPLSGQNNRAYLRALVAGARPADYVFGKRAAGRPGSEKVEADTIDGDVREAMKALGLSSKYPETNIHAVRKMVARALWSDLKAQGVPLHKRVDLVARFLGHGDARLDCIRTYVGEEAWKEIVEARLARPTTRPPTDDTTRPASSGGAGQQHLTCAIVPPRPPRRGERR